MSSHQRPLSVAPRRYTVSPYNRTRNPHTPYLSLPSPYDIRDMETRTDLVNSALYVWSLEGSLYLDSEPENADQREEREEEEKCPICFDRCEFFYSCYSIQLCSVLLLPLLPGIIIIEKQKRKRITQILKPFSRSLYNHPSL
jgi:hypothetical protein